MTHITASSRNSRSLLAQRSCMALAIACTSLACAARDLDERDLGSTAPPLVSNGSVEAGERLPVVGLEGAIDPFVEGHWVGQAENLFAPSAPSGARPAYAFPSGSTDFTLDISLADPTIPSGQIVFGSAPVPEPEPGVVYPPGFNVDATSSFGSLDLQLPPLEGLAYPLIEYIMRRSDDSGVSAGALALSYSSNAAYFEWCSLQIPRPTGDGRFNCLSPSDPDDPAAACAVIEADGTQTKFDCDLGVLCSARNVCECTETACSSASGDLGHIWLIRDGDDLLGTFVDIVFAHSSGGRPLPVGSVRFQRVDP